MAYTRRPAAESDMGFARHVHHQAYRDVVQRQFGAWIEDDQDRYFAQMWAGGEREILLCDGKPCGFVSIVDGADEVTVRELVLLPAFQGRGIGSAILRDVMEAATIRGVPVRLRALHQNRAIALYRRLGFRETGRTEIHVYLEWRAR